MAGFKPGTSGNPRGRPPGIANQAKLRKAIAADIPDILSALTEAAKRGDTTAAKLLLDRALPALKPQEQPVVLPLGATLTDTAGAFLQAIAAGKLPPEQGSRLLQALGTVARIAELDELTHRIEALEARQHEHPTAH